MDNDHCRACLKRIRVKPQPLDKVSHGVASSEKLCFVAGINVITTLSSALHRHIWHNSCFRLTIMTASAKCYATLATATLTWLTRWRADVWILKQSWNRQSRMNWPTIQSALNKNQTSRRLWLKRNSLLQMCCNILIMVLSKLRKEKSENLKHLIETMIPTFYYF